MRNPRADTSVVAMRFPTDRTTRYDFDQAFREELWGPMWLLTGGLSGRRPQPEHVFERGVACGRRCRPAFLHQHVVNTGDGCRHNAGRKHGDSLRGWQRCQESTGTSLLHHSLGFAFSFRHEASGGAMLRRQNMHGNENDFRPECCALHPVGFDIYSISST